MKEYGIGLCIEIMKFIVENEIVNFSFQAKYEGRTILLTRDKFTKSELIFEYINPGTEVGGCYSVYTETYQLGEYVKVILDIFEIYNLTYMDVSC